MKRCGWLIIALLALQGLVLGATTACRLAPVGFEATGVSATATTHCQRAARADGAPVEPDAPAQACCFSCLAFGGCGPHSAPPVKAEALIVDWPSLAAFSISALDWNDPLTRRPAGWSTAWSSRAPPSLS